MAGTWNFQWPKRATVDQLLTWKNADGEPIDLTGWTAAMQVRTGPGGVLLADIAEDGEITLGGTAGTVRLQVPAAVTADWAWSRGMYDLLLTDPEGARTRLLQGLVTLTDGITQ